MKRVKISLEAGRSLIKNLGLVPGDSFSNPEPSDLCYEYRMETGYWLNEGRERLVHLSTTKDEQDQKVTEARLELNLEALGIDPEDINEEHIERAKKTLVKVSEIVGENFNFEEIKSH